MTSGIDYRRVRRMISNRESARRSRMRKQRHVEDLRAHLGRLRAENCELSSRLGAVSSYCQLFRHDNDRLRSESLDLRRRLSEIRRLLLVRQLQRLSATLPLPLPLPTPMYGFAPTNELNSIVTIPSSVIV